MKAGSTCLLCQSPQKIFVFDIKNTIRDTHTVAQQIAEYLLHQQNLFILGKFNCEAVSKEGALKIKEIGYLHTEGYNTSALKHGTYALINKGTPIILIMPDDENFNRNQNTVEEVKSRDAFVISISDKNLTTTKSDIKILITANKTFCSLLAVIPLQLIAYELALLKGHNPDFPKHLAKCVTTD